MPPIISPRVPKKNPCAILISSMLQFMKNLKLRHKRFFTFPWQLARRSKQYPKPICEFLSRLPSNHWKIIEMNKGTWSKVQLWVKTHSLCSGWAFSRPTCSVCATSPGGRIQRSGGSTWRDPWRSSWRDMRQTWARYAQRLHLIYREKKISTPTVFWRHCF